MATERRGIKGGADDQGETVTLMSHVCGMFLEDPFKAHP
jgi:hypothetical protein